jgi:hypothetical protein
MAQFRVLGGVIGLSVATAISTPYISTHLVTSVAPDVAAFVLERTENIQSLPVEVLGLVREAFSDGFNLQIFLAIGFAAAQFPGVALMWTNRRVQEEDQE